jgi:photosystem II stability/assembly factor-like uncharacterized protein
MKAKKLILALLFIITLSASAFGAWTSQEVTAWSIRAIDGTATTSMTTLCAVGNYGSVYISNDYGNTWVKKTSPEVDLHLSDVDIVGNSIWVAGTKDAGGDGSGRIFVSTDEGASWQDKTPSSFAACYAVKFGSSSNGVIVGKTDSPSSGFESRYTSNGGTSWNSPSSPHGIGRLNALDSTDANTYYAASSSNGYVHKTTDGGDTWVTQETNVGDINLSGIHFPTTNTGYVVGGSDTIAKTTDGGASWEALSPPGSNHYKGVYFVSADNGEVCGDQDSTQNGRIISTANGGSNWTTSYSITGLTPINDIFFLDTDNRFAVGQGGSGFIVGNVTPITLTLVEQTARPGQSQAPRGFTGNLTLTGTNFQIGSWGPGNVAFVAAGITVNSVTWVSSTQLTANVTISASAALGTEDVAVTNIDGTMANLSSGFTVTTAPTISDVDDDYINPTQTKVIAITGTGFQTGATVSITGGGLTVGTTTVESAFSIKALVTASGAGTGSRDLTVTNPDGGVSNMALFSVVPVTGNPTVTDVSPATVYLGSSQTMTVNGTGFESGITVSFSTDGLVAGATTFINSTQFTFPLTVTSTAPTGSRGISVNNPSGGIGTKSNALFVAAVGAVTPEVTVLSPDTGYQGTSEVIQVIGSGFTDEAQGSLAYFNGSTGMSVTNVEFKDTGLLKLTVDIASNATLGQKAITVVNPDGGNRTKLNVFEVLAQTSNPGIPAGTSIIPGPNPWNPNSGDPLSIQFELSSNAVIYVNIYDFVGQLIYRAGPISVSAGSVDIDVLLSDIIAFMGHRPAQGPYLVTITTNGTTLGTAKVFIWYGANP